MRKIYLITLLVFLITLLGVSATQFNLPICWVTDSYGHSISSNCLTIDTASVNLSAYYTSSQVSSLLSNYLLVTAFYASQSGQNASILAVDSRVDVVNASLIGNVSSLQSQISAPLLS
ncbi:MAG TPA: hypothetical protein VMQ58_01945, partial [Candidatus Saccharimonadales bacterium]|nr:hypothetical protein [Candidatus Saccharimonadales bacterium]